MHLNLIYCRLLNTDLVNRQLNGVSLTLPYNHRKKICIWDFGTKLLSVLYR